MIDPTQIPYQLTATGDKIPAVGFGTFASDNYSSQQVAQAVEDAIALGYRHIDCAAVYNNEAEIGQALQRAMHKGVRREELWITSKLWNDCHEEENVIPAFKQSLQNLKLDYLDLYLIHWPFPNHHAPGCDVTSRSRQARGYIHQQYMKIWRQFESLVDQGLVRNIGTSNMTIPKLQLLLSDARIMPSCNEMELHPHFQQPALFDYLGQHKIIPIGFSPLGSPKRPDRDRTADDTSDLEDPVIIEIANKHQIHPASVCIKWAIQRGQIPIPFSIKERNYASNLQSAISPPLSTVEMSAIANIDKNCRLIKGQVFLWKEGQDWQDLWDIDGNITPP